MKLTATATALVVVDMQNAFCAENGGCARAGLPVARLGAAIEPGARLITAAREARVPIIFTRYVLQPDYSDGGVIIHELSPHLKDAEALIEGTWDVEVIDALQPDDADHVIDKNRPSAFYASDFEVTLKKLGIEKLVVCGVTTNCCVETTVCDASQRDYKTFLVSDAVAEFEDDRHQVALPSIDRLFKDVMTVEDVAAAWKAQPEMRVSAES